MSVSSNPSLRQAEKKLVEKGVVRDPAVHLEVIEKVMDYAMSIALRAGASFLFSHQRTGRKY